MTHVRSSASFLGVPLARRCAREYASASVSVLRIYKRRRSRALTEHSSLYHSPIDIDGERWTIMRRLIESRASEYVYVYASERFGVHAYRLVSIYARLGVSGPPAEKGPIPIVRLTNIVLLRPAFERSALLHSLVRLSRFTYSPVFLSFSLFERRSIDRSEENAG